MRLTAQQLEFLARLGKSPEGQLLQAMIKAEIDDTNEQLRTLAGEHLYRAQGKAVHLDGFAKHLAAPLFQPQTRLRQAAPTASDAFA